MPRVSFCPIENTGQALSMMVVWDDAGIGEVTRVLGDAHWRAGPGLERALGRPYVSRARPLPGEVRDDIAAILEA